jgi:hypothetical protein
MTPLSRDGLAERGAIGDVATFAWACEFSTVGTGACAGTMAFSGVAGWNPDESLSSAALARRPDARHADAFPQGSADNGRSPVVGRLDDVVPRSPRHNKYCPDRTADKSIPVDDTRHRRKALASAGTWRTIQQRTGQRRAWEGHNRQAAHRLTASCFVMEGPGASAKKYTRAFVFRR